ncbi:MAG: hypothetical protein RR614_09515 [Eubacterium sp.]
MEADKYKKQKKYLNKLSQFPLKVKPEMLEAFKKKCAENETTPTAELKKFIEEYIKK